MFKTVELFLHQVFIESQWSLSLAESCTGGSISARLTRSPGCSSYFLGCIVPYSNDLKIKWLNVKKESLQEQGAVSQEVVRQMAKGVIDSTGSDWGLAISGIAGPGGGSLMKPVGTMWGAIGFRDELLHSWTFQLTGHRQDIIQQAGDVMLERLSLLIKNKKNAINHLNNY